VKFYLGTHKVAQHWWDLGIPLFVSRRTLAPMQPANLPRATVEWALDSGGFTELRDYGEWRTTADEYVVEVARFAGLVGKLLWVAPQDWMCEPMIRLKTGLTVEEHQARTIDNFLRLRFALGDAVIPVLQGWTRDDYLRCWQMYEQVGVPLEDEETVGLGTICRRQDTREAGAIVRALQPLRLHGFGVKLTGLSNFEHLLASADSMAWSYGARKSPPLPGCTHAHCNNCPRFASRWYSNVQNLLGGHRQMEVIL
jgi:hypothetical protein